MARFNWKEESKGQREFALGMIKRDEEELEARAVSQQNGEWRYNAYPKGRIRMSKKQKIFRSEVRRKNYFPLTCHNYNGKHNGNGTLDLGSAQGSINEKDAGEVRSSLYAPLFSHNVLQKSPYLNEHDRFQKENFVSHIPEEDSDIVSGIREALAKQKAKPRAA